MKQSLNKTKTMNKETKQIVKDLETFARVTENNYLKNKLKELKQTLKTETK
jgi:hypothetical protein